MKELKFTIQLIGCYRSKKAYDMGYSINTNQHTPFASIENEKLIVEICDSLSIGAAIENMILTATGYGLGTLWIANTCFAYNELMDFIGTDSQLTGIVAVGFADESPAKRPRKPLEEIVEYRQVKPVFKEDTDL